MEVLESSDLDLNFDMDSFSQAAMEEDDMADFPRSESPKFLLQLMPRFTVKTFYTHLVEIPLCEQQLSHICVTSAKPLFVSEWALPCMTLFVFWITALLVSAHDSEFVCVFNPLLFLDFVSAFSLLHFLTNRLTLCLFSRIRVCLMSLIPCLNHHYLLNTTHALSPRLFSDKDLCELDPNNAPIIIFTLS